ncbi:MAG: cytochrome c [Verrucomicrobiota bacterium]
MFAIGGSTYLFFAGGYAPVATAAAPMPFEKLLARQALHARLEKEMPTTVPTTATEANLLAGATVYRNHCASCHGLPGRPEAAFTRQMFPPAPHLFKGKGVTDDELGETYWKAANGIRLTGMPGFRGILTDDQLWQVSLLLAKANELPPVVQRALATPD